MITVSNNLHPFLRFDLTSSLCSTDHWIVLYVVETIVKSNMFP